jgi:hypothetical protein
MKTLVLINAITNVLHPQFSSLPDDTNPELQNLSQMLARAMVQLYSTCREKFSPDLHEHYSFSPRDLVLWVTQLTRYDYFDNGQLHPKLLFDAWGNEARHIFRERLVGGDKKVRR